MDSLINLVAAAFLVGGLTMLFVGIMLTIGAVLDARALERLDDE